MVIQVTWKAAWMKFLAGFGSTHAITLAWNRDVSPERARADIRDLLHRVDRKMLGPNFHRFAHELRTRAVFVLESVGYNLHAHSLWRFGGGNLLRFNRMFPAQRGGVWNNIVGSGSYDIDMVNLYGGDAEFTGYILKGQHPNSPSNEIIFSDEFVGTRR